MNNKGYAVTAVIYPLLLICLIISISILYNMRGKHILLNNIKNEVKNDILNKNDLDKTPFALNLTYSNEKTECTNAQCAVDELYEMIKNK